ncbi:hypothetical protein PINS_up010650 [Pythium insidiosum]|nr:hypothetical protein PINS_up010650 [Pythium insidiosum]
MRLSMDELHISAGNNNEDQLQIISDLLTTHKGDDQEQAQQTMDVAVRILRDDDTLSASDVFFHTSPRVKLDTSIDVLDGVLLPLQAEQQLGARLALARFFSSRPHAPECFNRVAVIDGDVSFPSSSEDRALFLQALDRVNVLFVHGEVDDRVVDWLYFASHHQTIIVPIASSNELRAILRVCDAAFPVDSVFELLPAAIDTQGIRLRLLRDAAAAPRYRPNDDDDEAISAFVQIERAGVPCVSVKSVLVHAASPSLADELCTRTLRDLRRLQNVSCSRRLLPGGGSVLCACSAMLRETTSSSVEGVEAYADALLSLGVTLLHNSGDMSNHSFLESRAQVKAVERHFRDGIRDLGPDKFFAMCPVHVSQDYLVLPLTRAHVPMDDYRAIKRAWQRAFRVVELALRIDKYVVQGTNNTRQP